MGIEILTISATDWAKTEKADLRDYRAVGVNSIGTRFEHFIERIPEGTSVVVNYIPGEMYSGTALIPREKKEESRENTN